MGLQYVIGFERDTGPETSRTMAAARLAERLHGEGPTLATLQEPAPWSLPPVDLVRWRIVLPPRGWPGDRPFPGAIATVSPADFSTTPSLARWFFATPISWANKPFRIQLDSNQPSLLEHKPVDRDNRLSKSAIPIGAAEQDKGSTMDRERRQ